MASQILPSISARSLLERFRLDDKVVIVTGASSGLGVVFSEACARAGADVVVAARRGRELDETVELIGDAGRDGLAVPADVTREQDCRRIVQAAVERFGRVDVLVNNAGVVDFCPAALMTSTDLHHVLHVNVTGCFRMAHAAAEAMAPGSSIINISSIAARTTLEAPMTAYPAAKAALCGLTRALARQWSGGKGIRVNALLPGFFPPRAAGPMPAEMVGDRLVMGRVGDPAELAAALVFLASDASSYVTGAELVVDGGFTLA